jgi:hypothetical protein
MHHALARACNVTTWQLGPPAIQPLKFARLVPLLHDGGRSAHGGGLAYGSLQAAGRSSLFFVPPIYENINATTATRWRPCARRRRAAEER